MKVQVSSDLHLELLPEGLGVDVLIEPHPKADVLILAGDIHTGVNAIQHFRDWPVPVLYVPGNHEFYGQAWEMARAALKQAAEGTSIRVLDNDALHIGGVRFLGATLWTDYAVDRGRPAASAMELAGSYLKDHFEIRSLEGDGAKKFITPAQMRQDHQASRSWLEGELEQDFPGKTVVISHHAPHRLSIHRKYVGHPLTPAFASDLSDLMHQADLWIHGHAHDSFNYQVGRCKVVSNPAGYVLNRNEIASSQGELRLENPDYERCHLLNV